MDDERLPKRLFYGDVATGSRRQGRPIRRYKDTLKSSLKRLQINPTNWEELAHDRPTWRRTVKTGAAIYEANRIADAKVKREARKSQINCASRTPPASSSSSLPPTNSDNSSEPTHPSSSSSTAPTAATQPAVSQITNPDTTADTTPTASDSSDEDQDYTCPHCDRTFTSHIGLVGHLRIHRAETGEPVPGAPTYTHRTRLQCPHCPRTLTHRMGLFGRMRIHESGIDRNTDSSIMSNPTPASSPCAPTAPPATDTDTTDFIFPTLSTHIHLTHRPGRSLENPPHRDWRTSAWSTNLYPSGSSQLPTLPPHFQAPHGPVRPHAHPR
ncbi:hypothetical protein SprV_0200907500 [Sparganum proliferum]